MRLNETFNAISASPTGVSTERDNPATRGTSGSVARTVFSASKLILCFSSPPPPPPPKAPPPPRASTPPGTRVTLSMARSRFAMKTSRMRRVVPMGPMRILSAAFFATTITWSSKSPDVADRTKRDRAVSSSSFSSSRRRRSSSSLGEKYSLYLDRTSPSATVSARVSASSVASKSFSWRAICFMIRFDDRSTSRASRSSSNSNETSSARDAHCCRFFSFALSSTPK
mmetsp:Transcript_7455/g.24625  ORF Transcript_7455/g.24625 Transcript_7455/m.24625 type:complete len:227 (-) Transcript_7455:1613-2293(-)